MRKPFCEALIDESDLAFRLHVLFQNQCMEPGIVMGLRTRNDPIPYGERVFLLASTKRALRDGYTPVKVQNFASKNQSNST